MLYELRGYDVVPERWEEFLAWGDAWAIPVIFDQFNFRLVGRWQTIPKLGENTPSTNYQYLLAWESEEEMRARWAEALGSAAWKAAWAASLDPATGKSFYLRVQSTLLQPLPLSPLR